MTTYDFYLLKRYAVVFAIMFVSLYGLFVVFDGFTNVDAYQLEGDSTGQILKRMGRYYLFQSCQFLTTIGPLLSVMAVMVVLGMLYKKSEIQPVLAAGIPIYRVCMPFLVGTMLVSGLLAINQELVLPKIAPYLISRNPDHDQGKLVDPALDHSTGVQIAGANLQIRERKLMQPNFTLPAQLVSQLTNLSGTAAKFLPRTATHPEGWLILEPSIPFADLDLTAEGERVIRQGSEPETIFICSNLTFLQLYQRDGSFKYLSTRTILSRLKNPASDATLVRAASQHLHVRFTQPLANVIAVLIAVPLLVRRESRSIILNAAVSTAMLTIVYVLHLGGEYLGAGGMIAPEQAVWGPMIVSGGLASWLSGSALT